MKIIANLPEGRFHCEAAMLQRKSKELKRGLKRQHLGVKLNSNLDCTETLIIQMFYVLSLYGVKLITGTSSGDQKGYTTEL